MSEMNAPAAVLWDMDGTLIDSEPYWIAAEQDIAARFGVEWTHADGLAMVGNPLVVSAQALIDRGVDLPADEVIDFLLTRVTAEVAGAIPWQEDARALLEDVKAAGIPCALVTMSYTMLADAFVSQVPGGFDVVVTGDHVTQGKPHPEPYLTAARLLGVDILHCVALEDSPSGVASAYASGAATLGVRRLTPIAAKPGLSRVRTLEGISLRDLHGLANGVIIDTLGHEE